MMRAIALSTGAMVAIAASLNATAFATNQGANQNSNSKQSQTKTIEKREDGHTLTQKWLKVSDKSSSAFYHFNEIKDTDKILYQETSKEDRHYHSNTTSTADVDGKEQTTKRVVVYNINKNKTICNIVEHSKTGVTKDGNCDNIAKTVTPKDKGNCDEKKDKDSTPVVPNNDGDNEEVKDNPKEETKEEVVEQPKVVVTQETTKTPVQVTSTTQEPKQTTPDSLPVTGASPISGTLVALLAAVVTFVGYASALAFLEIRIKNQY